MTITVTGGNQPSLSVTDRGPGIPPEMQERIFERFVRGATDSRTPGSGLGLYLSRRLAELQRGSIDLVRTAPGEGSTFTFRLPAAGAG